MRIAYLLLHDFRFASIGLSDFAFSHYHFSKEYAKRMAELGHEVKLYVLNHDTRRDQMLQVDGYELKSFRTEFLFPPGMRFGNSHSLGAIRELDRDDPDIVHAHNYYLWNFPYVAPWVKRRGRPLVAQYHGSDPIRAAKAVFYCPSLRLCDRFLVPVPSEERLLRKRLRLNDGRVMRFPSTGVDTGVFHPTGERSRDLVLLYPGRVPGPANYRWEKAPQYLIPIVRALADLGRKPRLVVAGEGPGLEALKVQAKESGIDDLVDFVGLVRHEELPRLYTQATLTFIPIEMEEIGPYWGGALQESLACGTPVAAFNNGSPGLREFGLLIPTEPRAAARQILQATGDSSWLESVEEGGPRLVQENCEWSVMTRRLEATYRHLLGGRD